MTRRSAWLALGALAFAVRVPGAFWGLDPHGGSFLFLSYDEFATCREIIRAINDLRIDTRKDYFYGFGFEMIPVLAALKAAAGELAVWSSLIVLRLANAALGTAGVFATAWLARALSGDGRLAWLSGLFLALFPLHVIHSHRAEPAVSGTLWLVAASAAALTFARTGRARYWWTACAAAGAAAAVKFLFVAWIPVAYLAIATKGRRPLRLGGAALLALSFWVVNLGTVPTAQLPAIANTLVPDNFGGRDHNPLTAALMYAVGLVPGVGLFSFTAAAAGAPTLIRSWRGRDRFFCVDLPVLVQLVAICFLSSSFIRHAIPLLPWVAIAAAAGALRLWAWMSRRSRRVATAAAAFALAYQLGTVGWVEAQHVRSRMIEARRWLLDNVPAGATVALAAKETPAYANVLGLPEAMRSSSPAAADFIVANEGAALLPFRRSILNPFTAQPGPDERYGWEYLADPETVERAVRLAPGFRVAAFFPSREIFPEFAAHKRLFGSFNWLEGDVTVYEKTGEGPPSNFSSF